jgi:hypothetical protein
MAAVVWLPLVVLLPDQPADAGVADAEQPVALVELHVSIVVPPLATLVGFAVNVTVGAGGTAVTVTVAVRAGLAPPAPVHTIVKLVSAVSAPVDCVPAAASTPLHPPDAVQPVASVELHVSIEALPVTTLVGFALNVAVGTGGGVTVTVTV